MDTSRVAVVTGGASGMGQAVCRQLAERGHRVAVLDVNGVAAKEAAEELRHLGAASIGCTADVTDPVQVGAAVEEVRSELGPIGILVASAGLVAFESFTEISLASWNRVLDVNLTGTFLCVQAVVPDMLEAGWGRIVTISSSSAQRGSPGMAHYTAAKGGVIAMTRGLAREYASRGITVNTVPPSGIDTPMQRAAQAAGDLPGDAVMARTIPMGRLGTGDDIAAACVFLCSEAAGYITGQVLGVNGGSVI